MKAMLVAENGLELGEAPIPAPRPDEVLIKVHAAALNRADISIASGHKHGAIGGVGSPIGMEWAGKIVAVGDAVKDYRPGDRVMAAGNGGYAEYAIADMGRINAIPAEDMDYAEAATLPIALQTMHDAVMTHGELKPGQAVLIQGASSGVGLMGLQIARLMGAGLVIGSSTSPERRERLKDFGADLAVDSKDPGWVKRVLEATEGRGANIVIDQISGPVASQNLAATAILGRIVNVGRLGGLSAEFDFDLHAARRISYIGVTFRTRSKEEIREINRKMRADLWDAVKARKLSLPISATFPLADAMEALNTMKTNKHLGKIVLTVP